MQRVPGPRQRLELRTADVLDEAAAAGEGTDAILFAPNDKGRNIDAVKPMGKLRIVKPRRPGKPRGGCTVLQRHVDVRRGKPANPFLGERLLVERIPGMLLRRPKEDVAIRFLDRGNAGRREQRETAQARRIANRDLGGGPAAERVADEMNIPEIERRQQIEIEEREIADAAEPGRQIPVAEARMLGRDHAPFGAQHLEQRIPVEAAGAV